MNRILFISYILSFLSLPILQSLAQQELNPEQIYEKVNDAVVIVLTYDINGELRNQGSGVVISGEGYILTNYHVMENGSSVLVVHGDISISDVEIIGGDIEADILALRIPKGNFSFVELPESEEIKIGQRVYAIGSPMGYENTISEGIISGYRKFDKGINLIQITASISPGSSGGAVVNSRGELIGISTYTITEGQNLNFAIPIKDVMDINIEPYVASDVIPQETRTKNEKERIITYPEEEKSIRDPETLKYFNEGKKLISEAYKQENKKLEMDYLKKAVERLEKAIEFDQSFAEAYYLIGNVYDSRFNLNDIGKAKKYYGKVVNFIDESRSNVCDSISNREILVEIADFYRLQEEDIETNSLKAVENYKKALVEPLPKIIPSLTLIKDDDINFSISSTYHQVANYLVLTEDNYFGAIEYFDLALEFYDKKSYSSDISSWMRGDIVKDKKVGLEIRKNRDWKPFMNFEYKSIIYRKGKPLTSEDFLFMYHPKTMTKEKNNIVRTWIKEVNLMDIEKRGNKYFDYSKSLYEFDLKNNKYRVFQYTSYLDNNVMDDENYPNAEWEYIAPESIAEGMVENLKVITK
jgi:tetratricopeptide (TPR) repeat protein